MVRLAYITSLVPDIGESAKDVLDQVPKENQIHQAVDISCFYHPLICLTSVSGKWLDDTR